MQKITERIAALRGEMKKAGVSAYLIPSADPHLSEYTPAHWQARKYFSGFTGSAGMLAVTETKSGLWTDGRYFIQAERELSGTGIRLFRMGVKHVPSCPEFLKGELAPGQTVGLDGSLFSAADVKKLRLLLAEKDLNIKSVDLVPAVWPDRPPIPRTRAFLHDAKYAGRTCAQKLDAVRKELRKRGADGQIYGRLDCVAWLMNLRADDVEDSPFALAYAAVFPDAAFLFIDRTRVPDDAAENLRQNGVTLLGYGEVREFLRSIPGRKAVLADPAGINCELFSILEHNPGVTVKEGPDLVTELKSIKNETEIRGIREAHVRDGCAMIAGFAALDEMLAKGEPATECTVCTLLKEARARQAGNRGVSFATIAAYRENAAMMHYSPKPDACRPLEKGGFLLVDSGGQYPDGTTDITRTFALGPVTREEKEWYTRVLKSHIALATAVFLEGSTGGNLDVLCREPLWKHGMDYRCGTGHGVGMFGSVHEGPQNIRPRDRTVFRKGMTITNEPGVYVDGKFGIRTENLMLVDGAFENEYGRFLKFETVTLFPIDTAPVLPGLLTDAELAWLNDYNRHVRETLAPLLSGRERAWLERRTKPLTRGQAGLT
ncbi:MAG: aminopeptidase P family protein [Oscillospiraceae bacterium]|jgi:Xaa-Pro aminopeptidase|nr:aminopeptidase P family protein [Oscillospiraceae bacterium]MCI1991133.1 aminopeptidase P family protein [Oscillospiraceae bacterium]MCI2034770.1 aminopeptidase P family protein [Oscillospiraceae bacterium]